MPKKVFTLGRDEIIRGYNAFGAIFESGKKIETEYLSSFVSCFDSTQHDKNNVMVGFTVSKKKFREHMTGTGLSVC